MDASRLQELASSARDLLAAMQENEISPDLVDELDALVQKHAATLREKRHIIAVTGTMKAGKSTTLNALIGEDLLPSRERAMTTLPTLLRHNPQRRTAMLHLPAARNYNSLLGEMRVAFRQKADTADPVTARTLNDLANFGTFLDVYEGRDIKRILTLVNDLFRECIRLECEIPENVYQDTAMFPYIVRSLEIFSELGPLEEIWLMDTPGPNEAGMQNLGESLEKYLAQVAAIILVIDYTQQQSVAFEQLFDKIYAKNPELVGQTYVLLNKVDKWTSKDSSLEENCRAISGNIFQKRVGVEKIFPVSAKSAFYGLIGMKQLNAGVMPEALDADVWKMALGDMWEDLLPEGDKERALVLAAKLYDRSGLKESLKAVLANQAVNRSSREKESLAQIYYAMGRIGDTLNQEQERAIEAFAEKKRVVEKCDEELRHARDDISQFSSITGNIGDMLERVAVQERVPAKSLVTPTAKRDYWYSYDRCEKEIGEIYARKNEEFKINFKKYIKDLSNVMRQKTNEIQTELNNLIHMARFLEDEEKIGLYLRSDKFVSIFTPLDLVNKADYGNYVEKKRSQTSYTTREGISGWLGGMLDDLIDNDWGKEKHYEYETRYYLNTALLNEDLEKKAQEQINKFHEEAFEILVEPFLQKAESALEILRFVLDDREMEEKLEQCRKECNERRLRKETMDKLRSRYDDIREEFNHENAR